MVEILPLIKFSSGLVITVASLYIAITGRINIAYDDYEDGGPAGTEPEIVYSPYFACLMGVLGFLIGSAFIAESLGYEVLVYLRSINVQ